MPLSLEQPRPEAGAAQADSGQRTAGSEAGWLRPGGVVGRCGLFAPTIFQQPTGWDGVSYL